MFRLSLCSCSVFLICGGDPEIVYVLGGIVSEIGDAATGDEFCDFDLRAFGCYEQMLLSRNGAPVVVEGEAIAIKSQAVFEFSADVVDG